MPVVSVVIPFYNGNEYLKETIGALLNQSYTDWECLVVDDHSPVSGEAIVREFKDSRIKYIVNQSQRGMANARNWGCQVAQGKYIALNDQDDLSSPDRLKKQIEFLDSSPDFLLCGSWRKNFGGNNVEYRHEIDPDLIKIRLIGNSQFTNPTVMFRKSLVEKHGLLFRQEYAPSDDYDFHSRVVLIGKTTNIPRFLLHYRIHSNQESVKKSALLEDRALKIRENYINEMLFRWIDLGLNIKEMALFFSPFVVDKFSVSEVETNIRKWIIFNKNVNIFDSAKWENFLFERLILILPLIKGKRSKKLKLFIFSLRRYIIFGRNFGYIKSLKQIIKLFL